MKEKIIMIIVSIFVSNCMYSQSVRKEKKIGADGFIWYMTVSGQYRGAEDTNGNVIIPLSKHYNGIFYSNTGSNFGQGFFECFDKKKRSKALYDCLGNEIIPIDKKFSVHYDMVKYGYLVVYTFVASGELGFGICDLKGKEIISPYRGYSDVSYAEGDHIPYFSVNYGKGACDIYGREIITPSFFYIVYGWGEKRSFHYKKYEGDQMHDTGITLNPDRTASQYGYGSISSSSNKCSSTTIEFESIIAGTHGTSSLSKAERYRVKFELNTNSITYTLESDQSYSGSWTTIETHTVNPSSAQIAVSSNGLTVSLSENRGFAVSTSTKMVYIVDKFGNRLNDFIGDKWFLYHKTDFSSKYESLKSALLKYNWRVKN